LMFLGGGKTSFSTIIVLSIPSIMNSPDSDNVKGNTKNKLKLLGWIYSFRWAHIIQKIRVKLSRYLKIKAKSCDTSIFNFLFQNFTIFRELKCFSTYNQFERHSV
jgi:hypothetical protein